MVYQDSLPPDASVRKGEIKFEILLVKIFSLKKKTNQIPTAIEKIKFYLFNQTVSCSSRA